MNPYHTGSHKKHNCLTLWPPLKEKIRVESLYCDIFILGKMISKFSGIPKESFGIN